MGLPAAAEGGSRDRAVALLGLRGAGKSTVGQALAERLDCGFYELDARIESAAGLGLGEIFDLHGEAYYRRLQRETLGLLFGELGDRGAVIATGGSIVADRASYRLLRQSARTVWLRAEPEDHWDRVIAQGDRRPMANNPEAMSELRALLQARAPLYAEADITIDTHGRGPNGVTEQLLTELERVRRAAA